MIPEALRMRYEILFRFVPCNDTVDLYFKKINLLLAAKKTVGRKLCGTKIILVFAF